MSKRKQERLLLDMNVLEAAKERISMIYSMFDHVFVGYSGGKDSQAVLELVRAHHKEKGITDKINTVFFDEEIIHPVILDHVNSTMAEPDIEPFYFATPIKSELFVLGSKKQYIQWDPNREHIRPKPEGSISLNEALDQSEILDKYLIPRYNGSICTMLGLRASESINRLNGIFNGRGLFPFLNAQSGRVAIGKPIYDWLDKDIFRFFYDTKAQYCSIYDMEVFAGQTKLRVSTPLHAESAKSEALLRLKDMYPAFYDQILKIFPEVENQVRYFSQFKKSKNAPFMSYERSWKGVLDFIDDHIDDSLKLHAKKKVITAKRYREGKKIPDGPPFYGMPLYHVFNQIYKGAYKRYIKIVSPEEYTKRHYEFEGLKPPK